MRPRVLFVGPTRYELPLSPGLERKWAAIAEVIDYRVLARGTGSDERFELHGDFYARVPDRVRRAVRAFRLEAIVAEDPRVAALAFAGRPGVPVIVEVHGNWRHATRLYGSGARRILSPLVDALEVRAIRRADGVRALSGYTARLVEEVRGRPPEAVFPTYSDLSAFTATPPAALPDRPAALFVGVLEPTKGVGTLATAWRSVARDLVDARLVVVGRGSMQSAVDALVDELPGRVERISELAPEGVAEHLDRATVLVLPSRSEGLGRVVIEAFARGRAVVATRVGGIPDLVEEENQGLLVPEDDPGALAAALRGVLSDRQLAGRLGAAAYASFEPWNQSPELFARRLRALVDAVLD